MRRPRRVLAIITVLLTYAWLVPSTGSVTAAAASGGPSIGSSTQPSSDYPPRPDVTCEQTIKAPPPRCAGLDCDDPLFKEHPPKGTWVTQHCYEVTYPLHVYDSELTGVFGSADLAFLRAITEGSGYQPVMTDTGRGIAGVLVALYRDTNIVPYFETSIVFAVNENPVTVSTRNPYAYASQLFSPKNKLWGVKLLLSHHMPIEYGREIFGYDKNPLPQNMVVSSSIEASAVTETFRFEDPQFEPIMSGRVVIDRAPAARAEALRLLAAAPDGGAVLAKAMTEAGLATLNIVNPDVLHRTEDLIRTYAVIRFKSVDLGLWGAGSTLTINANSDYGGTLSRMGFQPMVSSFLPAGFVADNGFAP
jgi:hypothetical protein